MTFNNIVNVIINYLLDFDECTEGPTTCDMNADCINTDGSYSCACEAGYMGDGTTCTGRTHCQHNDIINKAC